MRESRRSKKASKRCSEQWNYFVWRIDRAKGIRLHPGRGAKLAGKVTESWTTRPNQVDIHP
jgi:hypothetical protein